MTAMNGLTILIYPLAGDPFEVIVGDVSSEDVLLEKITQAIDHERRHGVQPASGRGLPGR